VCSVIYKHFKQPFLFQVSLFIRVPKQMSRKAMKSPIGTHTPQQMLLAGGVSVTKFVYLSSIPFA
jgi:hypothetical protein